MDQTNIELDDQWILLDRLCDVILYNVPGDVVEIGTGESTKILGKHAINFGVGFHVCDYNPKRLERSKGWLNYDKAKFYHMMSKDFIKEYNEDTAIVFMDGSHKYKYMKIESEFFLEKLLCGGVLFIHDTTPEEDRYNQKIGWGRSMTSHYIRWDLEKRKDIDVFTWRYTANNCGLTMVYKKDMSEPEYRSK